MYVWQMRVYNMVYTLIYLQENSGINGDFCNETLIEDLPSITMSLQMTRNLILALNSSENRHHYYHKQSMYFSAIFYCLFERVSVLIYT